MKTDTEWLLEEKYNGRESKAFAADVARLEAGEPLAYVIGFVPFLNTKIYLDSKPLIPRSETEFWVEKAIAGIKNSRIAEPRILDLCAGSGCIGVAIAKAIPNARVDFAEIDAKHHPTILKNSRMNGIDESRVRIFGSDLFSDLPPQIKLQNAKGTGLDEVRGMGKTAIETYLTYDDEQFGTPNEADRQSRAFGYDFILSNPPYIDPALDRTEAGVKDFEPHQALFGGENGMEIIERIIAEAPTYLTENGTLYIEHEPEQTTEIQSLARKHGFEAITEKDQYGVLRYSILKKGL